MAAEDVSHEVAKTRRIQDFVSPPALLIPDAARPLSCSPACAMCAGILSLAWHTDRHSSYTQFKTNRFLQYLSEH